ncbi:hypothetical protein ScPMuIL_003989 [Solemya velum]
MLNCSYVFRGSTAVWQSRGMEDISSSHMHLRHQFHNLVRFVPSTVSCEKNAAPSHSQVHPNRISGPEARSFYEQLLTESPSQQSRRKYQSSQSRNDECVRSKDGNKTSKSGKKHDSCIDKHDGTELNSISPRGGKRHGSCIDKHDRTELNSISPRGGKRHGSCIDKHDRKEPNSISPCVGKRHGSCIDKHDGTELNSISPRGGKRHGSCIDKHDRTELNSISPHGGKKSCLGFNKSGRSINKLLMSAQNGDITSLRKCLETGTPIDSSDEFGWTALMCAVHAGHAHIVQYLLGESANVNISDSQGRTAFTLSDKQGNRTIRDILQQSQKHENDDSIPSSVSTQQTSTFYCASCKSEFTTSKSEHNRSLVHQITSKKTVKRDPFLIPVSNRGYRLMQKSGWDGESGLGPEGRGNKFPVKTVLKKDRSCLGTGKTQNAKVTHFKQNDTKAVENFLKPMQRIMSVRTMSKRARLAKERKNKQWERNMRLHFSTD